MTDSKTYFRPIPIIGPSDATVFSLAGGAVRFAQVEVLARGVAPRIIAAAEVPDEVLTRLTQPRAPIAGVAMDGPKILGIVNVTPDSFSDGGKFNSTEAAHAHGHMLWQGGANFLDIGGESTRPGAVTVPEEEEIARVAPVIAALARDCPLPISVDTRKAAVGAAAVAAGATIINDVSGFTYDPALGDVAAGAGVAVCVMHTKGDPQTMHLDPRYDDVLLEVYDFLEQSVDTLVAKGIQRDRITIDPGIGFGKTQAHNLAILARLSLFHGIGCPILLGVSRKRFIGTIGQAPEAADRVYGSIAVVLHGAAQGAQILRVHDVRETASALALWAAVNAG